MCNKLHKDQDFREITPKGTAYKIFVIDKRNQLASLMEKEVIQPIMKWDDVYGDPEKFGFGMFLSEREAIRIAEVFPVAFNSKAIVVRRIKYSGGLGEFIEDNFITKLEGQSPRIALCNAYVAGSKDLFFKVARVCT